MAVPISLLWRGGVRVTNLLTEGEWVGQIKSVRWTFLVSDVLFSRVSSQLGFAQQCASFHIHCIVKKRPLKLLKD